MQIQWKPRCKCEKISSGSHKLESPFLSSFCHRLNSDAIVPEEDCQAQTAPKERLPRKASVCGRNAGRFAVVLVAPASSTALQVNFADTYPFFFALHESDSRRFRLSASLPEAVTTLSCSASPRAVLLSGVLLLACP